MNEEQKEILKDLFCKFIDSFSAPPEAPPKLENGMEYLSREDIMEQFHMCQSTVSMIKKEMVDSGLYPDECILQFKRIGIDRGALQYHMGCRKALKAGKPVARYVPKRIAV